jgi:hypothetical protein
MTEISITSPVIVVTLRGPGSRGGTLKDPVIVTIDGSKFLSGTSLAGEGHWSQGQRMHIALDEIAMMVEFDSEDAHRARGRRARQTAYGIRHLFRRG